MDTTRINACGTMQDAELTGREVLLESPKRFVRDQLRMRDGVEIDWYFVDCPASALVVPVTAAGNLVMVRQYRYNLRSHVIEFPAGMIGDGEPPEQAARREMEEETGFALAPGAQLQPLGVFYSLPSETNKVTHVYLARPVVQGAPPVLDTEIEKYFDMSVIEMPLADALAGIGTRITGMESVTAILMTSSALAVAER